MSTFKVTVEKLTILPHPNADALELAQVGLYRAVVAKGVYKTDDYAVYIPEQAVLPENLIEELGLTGRLAGPLENRVKAIRLRGELSQGIVCRPKAVHVAWGCQCEDGIGEEGGSCEVTVSGSQSDLSQELGISKWVPPVPVGMAGEVEAAPHLLPWVEIENIKRYPGMFETGEEVVVTEKVHGTCFLLTYDVHEEETIITSKGMGGRNLALIESDTNLYWRAAKRFKLPLLAAALADRCDVPRVGLFGEVYGKGVQDLHYGANAGSDSTLGFCLFDVMVQPAAAPARFLDAAFCGLDVDMASMNSGVTVRRAPVLYRGPYDYEVLVRLAEGKEQVSGREFHLREGLVVRPAVEAVSELTGGRKIAKFVSEAYLTRKNGTEFE